MSLNIAETFNKFCDRLKMSDDNNEKIIQRYHQITKRINIDYYESESETNHSFYVGSYGRGTEIYTSDIDIVIVLPYSTYEKFNDYENNGQSALLQEVKNVLKKTYSSSEVGGDGQVVAIEFYDGIKFEIVPAFLNKYGSYTYPDSKNGGKWITMDPKAEINEFNTMNNTCNGNLKKFCKMVREWNKKNGVCMSGILIDTTVYRFLSNYEYKDKSYLYYDWFSRDYFDYLYEHEGQNYWYVFGSNWQVSKKYSFKNDAKRGYENSLKAIEDAKKELRYAATNDWREVYGSKFPDFE